MLNKRSPATLAPVTRPMISSPVTPTKKQRSNKRSPAKPHLRNAEKEVKSRPNQVSDNFLTNIAACPVLDVSRDLCLIHFSAQASAAT